MGGTYLIDSPLIQIRDQIPEDVSMWSLNQTCALANAELDGWVVSCQRARVHQDMVRCRYRCRCDR